MGCNRLLLGHGPCLWIDIRQGEAGGEDECVWTYLVNTRNSGQPLAILLRSTGHVQWGIQRLPSK